MSPPDENRTLHLSSESVQEPESGERRPMLVVLHGDQMGQTLALGPQRTLIGRSPESDLVLADHAVSRQHAAIARFEGDGGGGYLLEDLASTNGTLLNGTPVREAQLLRDGDKIRIGEHLLKFAWLDATEAWFQSRLHEMTQRDELTGLRSRRSLFAELERELARRVGGGDSRPLAILMLDVDHFRRVNDEHGHLTGSSTVRAIGHVIRDCVESEDWAARYGGEEFLAFAEGGSEAGRTLAERIRSAVETASFSTVAADSERRIHVTISIGVASYPEAGSDALDLVQKADRALYRAKHSGRNRVCVHDPRLDSEDPTERRLDRRRIEGPADAQ